MPLSTCCADICSDTAGNMKPRRLVYRLQPALPLERGSLRAVLRTNSRHLDVEGPTPVLLGRPLAVLLLAFAFAGATDVASRAALGARGSSPPPPATSGIVKVTSAAMSLVITTPPPTIVTAAPQPTPAPRPAAPTPPARPAVTTTTVAVATPAPTPRPTPAVKPFSFPYLPPLSLDEACNLMRNCVDILAFNDTPTLVGRCQKAIEIMDVTSNYLTVLDRRNSHLASYEWHFIDREKVDRPGIDSDVFRAQPVLPNVSAISFAAELGDAFIYSVEVLDAANRGTTFTLARLIEERFPHEEICYLFFPTTLRSVTVKYEARGDVSRTPRLTVFAGIARQEEFLKQALWYLRCARLEADLAMRGPTAPAPHLDAACQNLRLAAKRVVRFRVKEGF